MKRLLTFVLMICCFGCTGGSSKPKVWVYTSAYPHVVKELDAALEKAHPEFEVEWYQSGSENVATKVNSELLAGSPRADLILTSDPFWYEDLKQKKKLLHYDSPAARTVAKELRDPDGFYSAVRVPLMVIAYHPDAVTEAPKSFADLADERFKGKVVMPNPLESGTTFTTVAVLSRSLGWDYFKRLRANDVMVAGGNSAAFARIESKERPVGVVLLENVLAAEAKGSPIKAVYPTEGAVPIVSPVAILAATKVPDQAKIVYDFLFSEVGSRIIVEKGLMHSPLPTAAPPAGAKPLAEILTAGPKWNAQVQNEILKARDAIKSQFSVAVLE